MYVTIQELAEYLSVPETEILKLIHNGKIRAVYDGEQYVINKDQFDSHLRQMGRYWEVLYDYLYEPVPNDTDLRDND